MAIDEAILASVSKGNSPPTLRFYSWNPPAVSVGYFQNSLKDINLDSCREMGIDVVRRLTGGRAVLHDKELTYSLICPADDPHFPDNILGAYRIISSCIVKGLNSLGLDASLTPSVRKTGRNAHSACFTSPSHYEITVSGRKLVGSAQRRCDSAFLQHGSILLEFDGEKLRKVLSGDNGIAGVTSVKEHLALDVATLISSVVSGFEVTLGINFAADFLCEGESMVAERLKEEKYCKREWNF